MGLREFAAAFAGLYTVSFPTMPTCADTFLSTTLLLLDRAHRLLCSWVGRSVGAIHERLKSRHGVREQDSILLAAVFLNQVFWGRFQGVKFYSVALAKVAQLGCRGRKWFRLDDGCRHHCLHS